MPRKSHSFLIVLALCSLYKEAEASEISPFENAALGQCFDSADSFVKKALGDSALKDTNIVKTISGSWTWIVDQTASKNYTWYLLENKGSQICLRVYVPSASHVEFKKINGSSEAEAFIAPEIDFPAKLVEFIRQPEFVFYRATHCYIITGATHTHIAKKKEIPCQNLYD